MTRFDPIDTVQATAKWLILTGVALTGAAVLAGVRWWRWIAADEDEIGD